MNQEPLFRLQIKPCHLFALPKSQETGLNVGTKKKKVMPMSLLPKPVGVILSGKCVFADVIQLKIAR